MNNINRFEIIESIFAVERDGYEDKEIRIKRGGFWSRIFDPDPSLHIWDDYKTSTIKVEKYKPALYRLYNQFIVHPSLTPELKNLWEEKITKSENFFRWDVSHE